MPKGLAPKSYAALKRITPLRVAVRVVRGIIERYRRSAWILDGREQSSGEPLKVFFAGQLESKNYFAQLVFGSEWRETDAGAVWSWNAFSKARHRYSKAGLVVAQMGHHLQRLHTGKGRFFIPCWVKGHAEVPETMESLRRKKLGRDDLRRIRREGFRYEVTTDKSVLRHFFEEMYLPHVGGLYGDHAFLESYEKLESEWAQCELVLILQDDRPVAGQVLHYDLKGGVSWWILGVHNADRELVRKGVIGATYYFCFQHLSEKGYKSLNISESRPFLRDGLLRYKRKWGMYIPGPYHAEPGFVLGCDATQHGAAAFLVNNPFIAELNGKLIGVIFRKDHVALAESELNRLCAEYGCPGISEMHVYSLGREAAPMLLNVHSMVSQPAGTA